MDTSNYRRGEDPARQPQARTLEQMAAGLGLRVIAVDTGGNRLVADIAEDLAAALADDDRVRAYELLLEVVDTLDQADDVTRILLSSTPPRSLNTQWYAAIAGVVEWKLSAESALPIPQWVAHNTRTRELIWTPSGDSHKDIDERNVPDPLSNRGVWLDASALISRDDVIDPVDELRTTLGE